MKPPLKTTSVLIGDQPNQDHAVWSHWSQMWFYLFEEPLLGDHLQIETTFAGLIIQRFHCIHWAPLHEIMIACNQCIVNSAYSSL